MYTFLLILLVLTSLVLVGAILLQSGKGGGISANFGGASSSPDSFIGMRQAGNLLTQISWWGSGLFLLLAFVLQIMSTRGRTPKSVLEGKLGAPAPAPLAPQAAAPAVPLSPAGTTPTPVTPTPSTTSRKK